MLLTMPKKKPATKTREGQAALNLWIDEALRSQLDAYIAARNAEEERESKTTITSSVEAALRAFLKSKGYWPIPKT